MQNSRSITKYVADWLKRADEDIQVAEILIKEGGLPNSICFHSHQASEKYFKAFLAFWEKHVRKTHDIERLITLCEEIDKTFQDIQSESNYLSKFYIETRYPGDYPEFTLKEAMQALEAAKKIKEFILEKIKDVGLS